MPFVKKRELRTPEILQRIFELRNQGSGFQNIAQTITEEFKVSVTHPTAKNLYYEYAAKQKIKQATGKDVEVGKEWDTLLTLKFERIEKITNTLLDAVETIKDKLSPEMYLKYAPTIIAILRESLNQLTFIRNEQKEIIVKQENMIYSPIQILAQINQIEANKQKEKEIVIVPNAYGISEEDEEIDDEDEETDSDLDEEKQI